MRVINVIKTERNDSTIENIYSFGVFDEQFPNEVAEQAEIKFVELCKEDGIEEEIAEEWLEDGYCPTSNYVISIVWSDINEG